MNNLRIGQEIMMAQLELSETGGYVWNRYKYTIKEIYSNHVLTVNKKGFKRCWNKGDLVINGIIKQEDKYEALRRDFL